jgi:predicted DNA repair protein MutK
MLGGAYLCFEGFEKLAHKFLHSTEEDHAEHAQLTEAVADPATDLVAFEKDKIKGAVRTDFILSAEIIAITLGTVAGASLTQQVIVLSGIAIVMTIGVYGLVGVIVKLDDGGLYLSELKGDGRLRRMQRGLGRGC